MTILLCLLGFLLLLLVLWFAFAPDHKIDPPVHRDYTRPGEEGWDKSEDDSDGTKGDRSP